jgi:signal transduction histidine kinase
MLGKLAMSNNNQNNVLSDDDLMGLIVHSYNNFLAGMMGYSELAMLECENTEVEERLCRSLASGNEAVHFGKTILASLGRLQVPMQACSLIKMLSRVIEKAELEISVLNLKSIENVEIKSEQFWFEECLSDLVDFLSGINKDKKIRINIQLDEPREQIIIALEGKHLELSEKNIEHLFAPYHSSRNILGTKDIGLAKAKGFFEQMNAELKWKNGQGFILSIPYNPST